MDTDFAVVCPLVQHRMPQIQFLYIGSRLCSTLLSGPASRRVSFHPCALLSLHVHHVVKRTCTSRLSNMLGTHEKVTTQKVVTCICPIANRLRSCPTEVLFVPALSVSGFSTYRARRR